MILLQWQLQYSIMGMHRLDEFGPSAGRMAEGVQARTESKLAVDPFKDRQVVEGADDIKDRAFI